jgi:hypothetical protein
MVKNISALSRDYAVSTSESGNEKDILEIDQEPQTSIVISGPEMITRKSSNPNHNTTDTSSKRKPMGPTLHLHRDSLRSHHPRTKTPHRPRIPITFRNRRHDRRRRKRRTLLESRRHRHRSRQRLRHRHRSRGHGSSGILLRHRRSRSIRSCGV